MDAEVYRRYIPYVLSDVAERRTLEGARLRRGQRRTEKVLGKSRKVFIRGDHICYQGLPGLWDSDAPLRLAMAVAAAELLEEAEHGRNRGNHNRACILVAERIMASPCERLRNRFLKRERDLRRNEPSRGTKSQLPRESVTSKSTPGISRMEELDLIIADQARRNAARRRAHSQLLRLAATVRTQVARFRRKNPWWRSELDVHLADFRFTFYRDSDWYATTEREYESWLSYLESLKGPLDWCTAMPIAFLAEIYHEQGKYAQALRVYRKGIRIARGAIMPEELRIFVIQSLRVNVKACRRGKKPIPTPAYPGSMLPRQCIVLSG